jgi:hypothetical protein
MIYGLVSGVELQAFASHFLTTIGLYMNYCLLLIRACALVLCTESVSDDQGVWCSDISARLTSEAYGSEVGRQYPSLGLGNSYCFKLKLVGRDGKESNHRFNCGTESLFELVCAIAQRIGDGNFRTEPPRIMVSCALSCDLSDLSLAECLIT